MTNITKAIVVVGVVATSFAVGRWSVPAVKTVETQVIKNDKTKQDTEIDVNKHKDTTVTETVRPDGTKQVVTHTTEDTNKQTNTEKTDETNTQTDSKTTEVSSTSKVTVSVLTATSTDLHGIVYGGSVTKPVLGPITLGVFGFTSGVFGASVGLTF